MPTYDDPFDHPLNAEPETDVALYEWRSDTLADWTPGTIVSFGRTEEEARERAKAWVLNEFPEKNDDIGVWDYNRQSREGLLRDLEGEGNRRDSVVTVTGSS